MVTDYPKFGIQYGQERSSHSLTVEFPDVPSLYDYIDWLERQLDAFTIGAMVVKLAVHPSKREEIQGYFRDRYLADYAAWTASMPSGHLCAFGKKSISVVPIAGLLTGEAIVYYSMPVKVTVLASNLGEGSLK